MIDCSGLLALQEHDLALDEIDRRIHKIQERVQRLEKEVAGEEALVIQKEALLKKILLRKKQVELEMGSVEDKIKIADIRMKSAGLSPTTYQTLQKEIDGMKGKLSEVEGKVLEDMEKVEVLQKDLDKGHKIVGGRKQLLADTRLKAEQDIRQQRIAADELKTRRKQTSLTVPTETLVLYEDLRARGKGRVVWDVEKPGCPACGFTLPGGVITLMRASGGAEPCPNCSMLMRWTGIADGIV